MVIIKNEIEIALMKKAGHINYLCHRLVEAKIKPGITTKELARAALQFIRDNGCEPSFLNYQGYPGAICISINEEVVHGIPSERKLKEGDIVSIDIGVCYQGYHSDSANTYPVGNISSALRNLISSTKQALELGMAEVKAGVRLGNVSNAIETHAKKNHLGVIRELVGHGVGKEIHEDPDVPNYGAKNKGLILEEGMTIAIEPMLNLGSRKVYLLEDGWTIVTADNRPSAHFEHTILVTKDGYINLTGE
ncbi:MAG TPA: type I methionyl aminopeptidase [Bacilli bacterium]|nr:type I methionyl aminopeptidase [Bacilli bacterium]